MRPGQAQGSHVRTIRSLSGRDVSDTRSIHDLEPLSDDKSVLDVHGLVLRSRRMGHFDAQDDKRVVCLTTYIARNPLLHRRLHSIPHVWPRIAFARSLASEQGRF